MMKISLCLLALTLLMFFGQCLIMIALEHSPALGAFLCFCFCCVATVITAHVGSRWAPTMSERAILWPMILSIVAALASHFVNYSPSDLIRWQLYGFHQGAVKTIADDPVQGFWRITDAVPVPECARETTIDQGEGDYQTFYAYGFRGKDLNQKGFWVVTGKRRMPNQLLFDKSIFQGVTTKKEGYANAPYNIPKNNQCSIQSSAPALMHWGRSMSLLNIVILSSFWVLVVSGGAVLLVRGELRMS